MGSLRDAKTRDNEPDTDGALPEESTRTGCCASPAVVVTDPRGVIAVFSRGAEALLGYQPADVVGRVDFLALLDQTEVAALRDALSAQAGCPIGPGLGGFAEWAEKSGRRCEREWTCIRQNGERLRARIEMTPLYLPAGDEASGFIITLTEVAPSAKDGRDELLRSDECAKRGELLNVLLRTIPIGTCLVEVPSARVLVANDAAFALLGRTLVPGEDLHDLRRRYPVYKLPKRQPYPSDELAVVLGVRGVESRVDDVLLVLPDGSERVLEIIAAPVRNATGCVWASVVTFIDATDRSQASAEMLHLAYHDHLTRLPNRRLFHDRLQVAINQARREGTRIALLSIDLDRFKPVNDTLGHPVGDLLLKAAAKSMQDCLRESDTLARIGGDEFLAILPGMDDAKDAVGVAEKIRRVLCEPFDLVDGHRVSIACSIGIALYPEHGRDEKRLLKRADEAMYQAKREGRNCIRLFAGEVGSMFTRTEASIASIMRIVWRKSFACGEESVDREHQELFRQANALIQSFIASESDGSRLLPALDDLIDYTASHFANEERLLAHHHYPGLEEHALKHRALVAQALELRGLALAGELTLGGLVSFLVEDVVVKHMLTDDRQFFPLFSAGHSDEPDPPSNKNT
ncbi:bacteriohemerythrin [Propionivibrio soli]|uniref:bacteriohemerythrin n=1 Tax=Propionivibrio soli TaxID=2976531 RepID=UPI0021E7CD8F|nr:bacteriohemerythrin [Propionivibrio soli]